jgi:hypothetical protein
LLQILDRIPLSAVTRYIHMTREAYLPTKRFKLKLVLGMELFSALPVLFSLFLSLLPPPPLCLWNSSAADLLVRHERCRLKKAWIRESLLPLCTGDEKKNLQWWHVRMRSAACALLIIRSHGLV